MLRIGVLGFIFVFGLASFGSGAIPTVSSVSRLWDSGTMLLPGEKRIASVDDEFIRRSARLRALFEQFVLCKKECEGRDGAILTERDAIVAAEWKSLLSRLIIRKDWGEARESKSAQSEFFRELDAKGVDFLRDRCVPRIEFKRHEWHSTVFMHLFRGFRCSEPLPPATSWGPRFFEASYARVCAMTEMRRSTTRAKRARRNRVGTRQDASVPPVPAYPMRINRYLALKKYCTRREADALVSAGKVTINGRRAVLGDKVSEKDKIDVNQKKRTYRYFAFNKPRGIITHSPQEGETDIASLSGITGVFPIGRLDKDSYGLILLTDDGRLTDALLNPVHEHEKEYEVLCNEPLPGFFKKHMEAGVDIEGYKTKPTEVKILGDRKFSIVLTEGKKHQIRRMCAAFGLTTAELKRMRIMNIRLRDLKSGESRKIEGDELDTLLSRTGLATSERVSG